MGDLTTRNEQAALDKLQKVCDGRHAKTTDTLQKCALLKQQQQLMTKLKAEEDARRRLNDLQAAALRLQGQRQQALAFVGQQMSALLIAGPADQRSAVEGHDRLRRHSGGAGRQPGDHRYHPQSRDRMLPELKLVGRAMKAFELRAQQGHRQEGMGSDGRAGEASSAICAPQAADPAGSRRQQVLRRVSRPQVQRHHSRHTQSGRREFRHR